MPKKTFELDSKLIDGELIVVKDGKMVSRSYHELIPELRVLQKNIRNLQNEVKDLKEKLLELAIIVKEK